MRRTTTDLRKQTALPDNLLQGSIAKLGQNLPHLFREETEEIDDLIRIPFVFLAQILILGANAHGASVGMTLPHQNAAKRYQRPVMALITISRPVFIPPSTRSNTPWRSLFRVNT